MFTTYSQGGIMKSKLLLVHAVAAICILVSMQSNKCSGQPAGGIFSRNVSLLSRSTYNGFGGANDFALWRKNGKTYAIATRLFGICIFDVTDPKRPSEVVYLELKCGSEIQSQIIERAYEIFFETM